MAVNRYMCVCVCVCEINDRLNLNTEMLHRQTVCWEAEGKVRRGRVRGLWCSCGQSSTASTSRWFLHWTRSRLHRWSVPQSQRNLTCQNNTRLCYLLTERTAVCRRHNDLQMYIYTRAFSLKSLFNPLWAHSNHRATDHYTAIRWLVHWPLMGGLLHLVQQGGAWAGCPHWHPLNVRYIL